MICSVAVLLTVAGLGHALPASSERSTTNSLPGLGHPPREVAELPSTTISVPVSGTSDGIPTVTKPIVFHPGWGRLPHGHPPIPWPTVSDSTTMFTRPTKLHPGWGLPHGRPGVARPTIIHPGWDHDFPHIPKPAPTPTTTHDPCYGLPILLHPGRHHGPEGSEPSAHGTTREHCLAHPIAVPTPTNSTSTSALETPNADSHRILHPLFHEHQTIDSISTESVAPSHPPYNPWIDIWLEPVESTSTEMVPPPSIAKNPWIHWVPSPTAQATNTEVTPTPTTTPTALDKRSLISYEHCCGKTYQCVVGPPMMGKPAQVDMSELPAPSGHKAADERHGTFERCCGKILQC